MLKTDKTIWYSKQSDLLKLWGHSTRQGLAEKIKSGVEDDRKSHPWFRSFCKGLEQKRACTKDLRRTREEDF